MIQVCFAINNANNIPEFVNDRLILNYWTEWVKTKAHNSVPNNLYRQWCFSMQQPWGNYGVNVCASCFASVWMSVLSSGMRKNQWRFHHLKWNTSSWEHCPTSVPDDLGNKPYSWFSTFNFCIQTQMSVKNMDDTHTHTHCIGVLKPLIYRSF